MALERRPQMAARHSCASGGHYTQKLIVLYFALLLAIVFIPFSTALVFESKLPGSYVPMIFYNLNYIAATVADYFLFAYVLNPANGIMAADDPERIGPYRMELLFPLAVYALIIVASIIRIEFAAIFYAAFGLQHPVEKLFRRKNKVSATASSDGKSGGK